MSMPSDKEIRVQLERILQSSAFQRSDRLTDFLRYIVDKTLAGAELSITGHNIGVEVFGKSPDFNSDNDSSVRVEAMRLRKALALYYHEEGGGDPIHISIPKGGYTPAFALNPDADVCVNVSESSSLSTKYYVLIVCVACLSCFVILFGGLFNAPASKTIISEPTVAIAPFAIFGFSNTANEMEMDLAFLLNNKLSHFRAVKNVVIEEGKTLTELRRREAREHYQYLVEGSVQKLNGEIIIKARLFDTQQRTTVWSFSKKYFEEEQKNWKEDVTTRIVSQLASAHGIIDIQEYNKFSQGGLSHERDYKCILDYKLYESRKSKEGYHSVKECLKALVKRHPEHSIAWGYLSRVYGDEVRHNFHGNNKDGHEYVKKRSLNAAYRAVEADQNDARAHMYFANAAMLNGNSDLARRHIDLSVSLNPYDTAILIGAAWKLQMLGEWELGKEYAERAYNLHSSPPPEFDFPLFIYYYRNNMHQKALFHALGYFQPDLFVSHLILIAAYEAAGEHYEASKIVKVLNEKYPNAHDKSRNIADAWNVDKEFRLKIRADLEAAGVKLGQ